MINLNQQSLPPSAAQNVPTDPGVSWTKLAAPAIEPPPDDVIDPDPAAKWPTEAVRSGIYGVVSPRIVGLSAGGFRMYYTQIGPTPDNPDGANDYDNSTSRILSATSHDGERWTPEAGVRLAPTQMGVGGLRVVSSEVVPVDDSGLRMYFEFSQGPQSEPNAICSAVSHDGLDWVPESGARLKTAGANFSSPRIVILDDGRLRLYCQKRGVGIVSAISVNGLTFHSEDGVRIPRDTSNDQLYAFAPEIVRLAIGHYRMFYAGYSTGAQAQILTAISTDGLNWQKAAEPVIAPDGRGIDAVKSSEMCLITLPKSTGESARYRMFYEACDGTAVGRRGVWRIASAIPTEH